MRDRLPRRRCLRSTDDTDSILLHGLSDRIHLLSPRRRISSSGLGRLRLLHRLSERLRLMVVVVVVVMVVVMVVVCGGGCGAGDDGGLARAEMLLEVEEKWW